MNESIESVTKKYVDAAVKKVTDEHEKKLNELYEESETQKSNKYNEGKNCGYELGKIEEKERILEKQTKKIIKRNKRIQFILLFCGFFFLVILISVILISLFTQSSNDQNIFIAWINNNSVSASIFSPPYKTNPHYQTSDI